MGLKEKIEDDTKGALKSGEKDKVSALRMLSAAIKNRQIEKRRPLTDEEVIESVHSLIKQRRDSIEQFAKGGRQDLVDKESAEIKVLEVYLPPQMSAEEIESRVREVAAQGPKDMGKVMKAVMPLVSGRADGKLVSEIVKKVLG